MSVIFMNSSDQCHLGSSPQGSRGALWCVLSHKFAIYWMSKTRGNATNLWGNRQQQLEENRVVQHFYGIFQRRRHLRRSARENLPHYSHVQIVWTKMKILYNFSTKNRLLWKVSVNLVTLSCLKIALVD